MAGFEYFPDGAVDCEVLHTYQLAASVTVYAGDAVKFSSGKVTPVSGQTDVAIGVIVGPAGRPGVDPTIPDVPVLTSASPVAITSGAAGGAETFVKVSLAHNGNTKYKIRYTPLVNDIAAESNAVTTTIKVALTDGSSSDLVGGYVFIPTTGEFRLITANTYSSNVVTLTVAATLRAITTGDTVRIIGFGPGDAAVQFGATNPSRNISNVIAELASGKITVHEVDPRNKFAIVSFNPA